MFPDFLAFSVCFSARGNPSLRRTIALADESYTTSWEAHPPFTHARPSMHLPGQNMKQWHGYESEFYE